MGLKWVSPCFPCSVEGSIHIHHCAESALFLNTIIPKQWHLHKDFFGFEAFTGVYKCLVQNELLMISVRIQMKNSFDKFCLYLVLVGLLKHAVTWHKAIMQYRLLIHKLPKCWIDTFLTHSEHILNFLKVVFCIYHILSVQPRELLEFIIRVFRHLSWIINVDISGWVFKKPAEIMPLMTL